MVMVQCGIILCKARVEPRSLLDEGRGAEILDIGTRLAKTSAGDHCNEASFSNEDPSTPAGTFTQRIRCTGYSGTHRGFGPFGREEQPVRQIASAAVVAYGAHGYQY